LKIFLPVDVRKNKNKSSTVVFPTAPICKYQQLKTEHEIVSEAITRKKKGRFYWLAEVTHHRILLNI
jgi:hypothetical protein